MKYTTGNCIRNTVKKNYGNGDMVDINTKGKVLKVYELSKSYTVFFQGTAMPHRILEIQLKDC